MKNTVKYITYINRFILGVTLLLYVTLYVTKVDVMIGNLTQFVLGLFQVISFLNLLFFVKEFTEKENRSLLIYFMAVLLFFFTLIFNSFLFFLISMGIAIYFTYLLETLYKKYISTNNK